MQRAMPPVVDEFDYGRMHQQMHSDSRPQEFFSIKRHVAEELAENIEEGDGDHIEDESSWPDALALVLLLVDERALGDTILLSIGRATDGEEGLEDDYADENQGDHAAHRAVEVGRVEIGEEIRKI